MKLNFELKICLLFCHQHDSTGKFNHSNNRLYQPPYKKIKPITFFKHYKMHSI